MDEKVLAEECYVTRETAPVFKVFAPDSRPIFTIKADGNVELNPDFALDAAAVAFWNAVDKARLNRPTIVCLVGSTRFWDDWQKQALFETKAGRIVLSVAVAKSALSRSEGEIGDLLHMRRIELADEILVLNRGGYLGQSSRAQLAYAQALGKVIRSIEPLRQEV